MLYAIFAVLVIILDQGVKVLVTNVVHVEAGQEFIPGILSLVNVHNPGAAFSFLADSNPRIFFIILTGVFTLAVIIALATRFISGPLARWSIVMVTAGGISNCIDRVIYGYVLDMFKLDMFPKFPVFNVADIFITVFALLFVLAIIFEPDRRRDDEYLDDEFDDDDEDEDDEEDEEPAPRARRGRREKRARRRASRYDDEDDEDEDEDDEEEEEPAPKPRRGRRVKREEPEEEEEEPVVLPRPRRAAVQAPAESEEKPAAANREYYPPRATTTTHTSKYDAEYEKLKARRAQKQATAAAARPAAPVLDFDVPPFTPEAAPEIVPEIVPEVAPVRPAPAASRPSVSSADEFSLEDILAEFK